ncbi:MAG TPA: ribosomal protein S18-alanine N-acetyltransferase [Candidatus Dormibacteraeota bacterium]|nr:ribosomal protein S18-alanine N-acetyltransferase [Candidatus Dormibacteraeota bacterium]
MTAGPPRALRIEAMRLGDIPEVQAIERASFTSPWPPQAYRSELETNRLATYLVGRIDGTVVAYAGVWLMVDEAHITTFAVHPGWRRQRVGEALLLTVLDLSIDRGAREATLEVRLSNLAARRLYEKYGFRPVGLRPRYYTDNGEDALIMTTEPLASAGMRERLARRRGDLEGATAVEAGVDGPAPDRDRDGGRPSGARAGASDATSGRRDLGRQPGRL